MSDTSSSSEDDGRDHRGRFAAGNRHGLGNTAFRRQRELRAAVDSAVSAEDLQRALRSLADQAADGDVQAASLLLAYAVGRPRERAPDVAVHLPPLRDAKSFAEAFARVADAAARGDIEPIEGARLAAMLRDASDATVLASVEERLREAEAKGAP